MRKSYLVTGGGGFIGAALVKGLLREGRRVRVLDNFSRGITGRLADVASDVEFINGDIRDANTVQQAVRGVDGVCHLAYVNGTKYFYERPVNVLDVAVKGIVNVLDSCVRHRIPELILASSSEVYQTPPSVPTDESVPLSVPNPVNPRYSYGGGKIISELMCLNYGREYFERVVIFRPHNVFGPNMGWEHVIPEFIDRMTSLGKAGRGPQDFRIQGSGKQTRSFIYIDDFAEALMKVIAIGEHLGIYNIGTLEEISVKQVAHRIAECLGIEIEVVPGPDILGETLRRCPNVDKITKMGFVPRFQFTDALVPTVEWYRDHPRPSSVGNGKQFADIYLGEGQ